MAYHAIETASRETLRERQSERLRETVREAADRIPFYREAFAEAGVDPTSVDGVSEIDRLPFTTKTAFARQYPDGLFGVADDRVARVHSSSGTTGTPKLVAYTDDDLDVWRRCMARTLYAAGVRPGDRVQNAYGYGLFTGGLGMHDGIERLDAGVIPVGGGNTDRQLDTLRDLEPDALCCTPSYCLYLADAAADRGMDLQSLPVERVVIGAEPFTEPMRTEIERELGVTAIDIYGLSELIGPGVSVECAHAQDGLHVWEDQFYPEVIDPDTGEVLPDGQQGELVLTNLTTEATPMIRYRTGDITALTREPCDCGRTTVRMDNVTGRTDDLLIVRGVNVYPSQIETVVVGTDGLSGHYRIELDRENALDRLTIRAERHPDADRSAARLREVVIEELEATLAFSPDTVAVADPGGIERQETGKVRRVFDRR